jgi:hypothetical protein
MLQYVKFILKSLGLKREHGDTDETQLLKLGHTRFTVLFLLLNIFEIFLNKNINI